MHAIDWQTDGWTPFSSIVRAGIPCSAENTSQFTIPFKDDIRQLADLKQQISQKIILLRSSDILAMCCEVISSFVIFAVLDLRVGGCRP